MGWIMGGLCPVSLLINIYFKLDFSENELGVANEEKEESHNIIKELYKELRQNVKVIFFSIFYGASKLTIGKRLFETNSIVEKLNRKAGKNHFDNYLKNPVKSSAEAAKLFISSLNEIIPFISDYLKSSETFALKHYFSISPCGRIRRYDKPSINFKNYYLYARKKTVELRTLSCKGKVITVSKDHYERISPRKDLLYIRKESVKFSMIKSSSFLLKLGLYNLSLYLFYIEKHEIFFSNPLNYTQSDFKSFYDLKESAVKRISRASVNFPIQAMGSTVLRHFILRIFEKYPLDRYKDHQVRILFPRHDELSIELPHSYIDNFYESIKEIELKLNAVDLAPYGYSKDFMLNLDFKAVHRWSEAD